MSDYKVGIHFPNIWNILYFYSPTEQSTDNAVLLYWLSAVYTLLQFSSEFLTCPHFGKSGYWMLQCTCSNLAVFFAQPPLLLDHGWIHCQPKWFGSHQRLRSWAFLLLLLLLLSLLWLWLSLRFQCWHPLLQNRRAHLLPFAKALIASCKTVWLVFTHVMNQCA